MNRRTIDFFVSKGKIRWYCRNQRRNSNLLASIRKEWVIFFFQIVVIVFIINLFSFSTSSPLTQQHGFARYWKYLLFLMIIYLFILNWQNFWFFLQKRNKVWSVDSSKATKDEVSVVFVLQDDEATRKIW